MLHFLGRLLIAGGVGVCATFAARAIFREPFRSDPPRDAAGAAILRYGRGVWSLGIVGGIAIPVGVLWLQLTFPSRRDGQFPALIGLVVGFALLGGYLIAAAARVSARVGSDGVEAHPLLGRTRSLAWENIVSVRYSSWRGALVFTSAQGMLVCVPIMVVGLPILLDEMRNHLPVNLYEEAVTRGLSQLGATRALY